jgi:alanine-glyoxylate transaminase/serine-glyoxylate transaminase/serine-pyruvate transaminase
LCEIAKKYGCLTIVDAVTSLAGVELKVDEWGIDAIYSGSQKCLSCVPGLSPVSFSEQAADVIKKRNKAVQSWFLDQSLVMGYWAGDGKRSYHHTAPVNSLYAMHESLVLLKDEGLEKYIRNLNLLPLCMLKLLQEHCRMQKHCVKLLRNTVV